MVSDFSFFHFYDRLFRYVPALFCHFYRIRSTAGKYSGIIQTFFGVFVVKIKKRTCINRSKYFSILLDKIRRINDS